MKFNRKVKILLVATLASASCVSLIPATAIPAQAQQRNDDSRTRHHVVAQREEVPPVPPAPPRPPEPEPQPPKPPVRQQEERR